jgi:uncharacterized Ntn-hydrolase superfamily protein
MPPESFEHKLAAILSADVAGYSPNHNREERKMKDAEIPVFSHTNDPLAHTYSIVARDPETGDIGVAVQSCYFSVGSEVAWAEAGVGAVATQSFVNHSFGPEGLRLLKKGHAVAEVLDKLIADDEMRDQRQVAIIDKQGNAATWTGPKCIKFAGHRVGEDFSVQANMMLRDTVPPAMETAFTKSDGSIADRMMAALEGAEAEGGDVRGKQSASILIVKGEPTGRIWEDRMIDLRVEHHADPLAELRRLLTIHKACKLFRRVPELAENGDMDGAIASLESAQEIMPDNMEIRFWHAIVLATIGRSDEAFSAFQEVFRRDETWRDILRRVHEAELLFIQDEDLKRYSS